MRDLPEGLGALNIAYREALERIRGQKSGFRDLAEAVLSWIVCAQRQLTILELQCALAVEDGDSEVAEDNFPEADEMVSVCAGMVTVDEESGIIRLVHFTMQKFFESTLQIWAPDAQNAIAKKCLTYLSFDVFKAGPCSSFEDLEVRCQQNVLFNYAARYWGTHVESTTENMVEEMALGFLRSEKNVESTCQVVMYYQGGSFLSLRHHEFRRRSYQVTKDLKAMHLLAYLGLRRLAVALLRREQYVDHKDSVGRTPLFYAAQNGHEAVIQILLDQVGVKADCKDFDGRTPLSYVSYSGHVEVANLLMKRNDVDINSTDQDSQTPLFWAVRAGQEGIVMLLLERDDLQVCPRNRWGETPLITAARWGYESIARALLQIDGNQIYAKDLDGQTALHKAAASGHDKLIMLLLERDKDQLNAKDSMNQTALIRAVQFGRLAVVKLLLDGDGICINERDTKRHMSALMYATESGYETIVRLLLKRDEVQTNTRGSDRQTAVELAAIFGHGSIVKLLLERKDIDLNMDFRTIGRCSEPMITLIEQAKDRKYGGPSWRKIPYKVPSEKIDE